MNPFRLLLRVVGIIYASMLLTSYAFAEEPICVVARQTQCDPGMMACLKGAGSEAGTAVCMARFNECAERLRMSQKQCSVVLEGLDAVTRRELPRGRLW